MTENKIKVSASAYRLSEPSFITCGTDKYGRSYIWDIGRNNTPKPVKDAEMAFPFAPILFALGIGLIIFIVTL